MQISQNKGAGLVYVAVGTAAVYFGLSLPVGSLTQMGPGFLPRALAIMLMGLGAILVIGDIWRERSSLVTFRLRSLLIPAALISFALLLPTLGLIAALVVLVVLSALAGENFNIRRSLILAAVLSVACWLIFVVFLRLPIRLWVL